MRGGPIPLYESGPLRNRADRIAVAPVGQGVAAWFLATSHLLCSVSPVNATGREWAIQMAAKLVIFDCDGVLVDTEPIANEKLAEFLSGLGLVLTRDECRREFQGMMIEDVCRHVAELLDQPFDPSLPPRVRRTIEDAVAIDVKPVPGAVHLVHRVAASGLSYCVASSGSIPKMHSTLGPVGLLPMMEDVLFSAQDVERGKPHPDIFLAAAAAMGHRCQDAVVIEDSLSGVRAGVAAGARVLGYAGDPFTDADALRKEGAEIIHRMEDVADIIGLP